jgi:hypothetical protein
MDLHGFGLSSGSDLGVLLPKDSPVLPLGVPWGTPGVSWPTSHAAAVDPAFAVPAGGWQAHSMFERLAVLVLPKPSGCRSEN